MKYNIKNANRKEREKMKDVWIEKGIGRKNITERNSEVNRQKCRKKKQNLNTEIVIEEKKVDINWVRSIEIKVRMTEG